MAKLMTSQIVKSLNKDHNVCPYCKHRGISNGELHFVHSTSFPYIQRIGLWSQCRGCRKGWREYLSVDAIEEG